MQKHFCLFLFTIITAPVFAQNGAWYVGGNVGIFSNSSKMSDTLSSVENKTFTWSIAPDAGIYLTNHWQVGAGISIGGDKRTYTDVTGHSTTSTSTSYGAMVLARYFFTTTSLRPFAGISLGLSSGNSKTEDYASTAKLFSITGVLNGGFAYSFTPRFAALASITALRFTHEEDKAHDGSGRKQVNNAFSFVGSTNAVTFNLGVQYLLLKRPHGSAAVPAEAK